MKHYICKGSCAAVEKELTVCETEGCISQWEMLEECDCSDNKHGKEMSGVVVKDSNGKELKDGDDVFLTRDLDVKGSSLTLKRGDIVKKIKLIEGDAENIECKIGKSGIYIKTCFLKKA